MLTTPVKPRLSLFCRNTLRFNALEKSTFTRAGGLIASNRKEARAVPPPWSVDSPPTVAPRNARLLSLLMNISLRRTTAIVLAADTSAVKRKSCNQSGIVSLLLGAELGGNRIGGVEARIGC